MDHANMMTQQQFQEILLNIYQKGQETNMGVTEVINEIKTQLMFIMNNNKM